MKKLLLLTLALSLPLSQVVRADNDNDQKKRKRHAEEVAAHRGQQSAQPTTQGTRGSVRQPVRRASTQTSNQLNSRNRNVDRGNVNAGLQRNRGNANFAGQRNRGNHSFNRNSFTVARTRVIRERHDRGWWRGHFNTTFVLFGGGYYYWNSGYWYPAYGYSPIYNNYAYNEPIYGYNNLAPGQVLENVQVALRDQGYYRGPIDGLIGPETRAALAAYQRDNGLLVTSAVDEPTLVTLGLA